MQQHEYIQALYTHNDEAASDILESIHAHHMPPISVPAEVGKLITMLTRLSKTKHALEIGTLGGYSSLHILKGLPSDGTLTCLEKIPKNAELAEQNLNQAGFSDQVCFHTGPALEHLETFLNEEQQFDLFFIDANKKDYTNYLNKAVSLSRSGALILADNTLQEGRVHDETATDKMTQSMRAFNQAVADHPRLTSLLLPIGDGLTLAQVND